MGESIVEVPNVEDKMGECVASGATLESSVSFGRFERDSLSWEKWSSFSPNKYVEEVEKCSTPGSVAEKKAYFEAHYKKIAALKAVQLEQDKPAQSASPRSDELKNGNDIENTIDYNHEVGVSNGGRSNPEMEHMAQKKAYLEAHFKKIAARKTEHLEQEKFLTSSDQLKHENHSENTYKNAREFGVHSEELSIEQVEHEVAVDSVVDSTTIDDVGEKEDVARAEECLSKLFKEVKEELIGSQPVNTEFSDGGMTVLDKKEHKCEESPPDVLEPDLKVDDHVKKAPEPVVKNMKIEGRNITAKKTPVKKNQPLAGMKKQAVSPAAKASPVSAPRLSKPASSSPLMSTSKLSSKNLNGTCLPRNKTTTLVGDSKIAGPTSLHMSFSLGPSNCSVEPTSTRKSLIMEQMADKDIIKRAFKSFQNSYNGLRSSYEDKRNGVNQASSKVPERKVTSPLTPQKENEGLRKGIDEKTPARCQFGVKFSSASPGLGSSKEKKNVKALLPSVSLKSDASAEKRKEKLGQKIITREAGKAQLVKKSKEKDDEMKMLKQKSRTPVHTYTKGVSNSLSQKEGVKKSGLAR